MQATEQFSLYSNYETSLQTIQSALTHIFDPLPASNHDRFIDISKRIVLVVQSILWVPILMLGSAIEKLRSFFVYQQHKPEDFSSSKNQWLYFPDDVCKEVALHLEIKNLIAYSQTCKKLRHLILYSILPEYINSTHTSLQEFNFHPICLDHVLQGIGNQLSYLKLTKITSQVAHRWITFCPNLTHLHIEGLKNPRITVDHRNNWLCPLVEKGILKVEKLSYLSLMSCKIGAQEADQIATLKNLTYLNLWGNAITYEENRLITPKSLSSEDQSNQSSFEFHLTQLTYLNLSYTCNDFFPILPELEHFQSLTELSCYGIKFLHTDFSQFISALKKLPNFQKLSLANAKMSDGRAQEIASNLPNLTSLNLASNDLSLTGVIPILTSLKNLIEIDISLTFIQGADITQVVDAILDHHATFSRLIYFVNSAALQNEMLYTEQKERLIGKFPHCDVVLDSPMLFGIR